MYEDDPVRVYLNEMGQVPPLTREQEMDCARARDERVEIAEQHLVEANLALVVAIVEKSAPSPIANRTIFSAFAEPYIENAIEHAVVTSRDC